MKKCLVAFALSTALMFMACAQKPTVDDVVNKMVQTQGGAQALAAINDQVSTWDSKLFISQGDSTIAQTGEMTITYKRPNKVKFEVKAPDGTVGYATVFDGTSGWIAVQGQVMDMNPEEIQENTMMAETWIDGWHNYSAKGLKLALLADTTMSGKTYHVVQATDRFGNVSKNYCDAATGLIERAEAKIIDMMTRQKAPAVMLITDYASYDGFMAAKNYSQLDATGKVVVQATLKELKNNAGVTDEAFAKPTPPASSMMEHPSEKVN
jgi:outer membrane lipoprotein-sorting protein